MIVNAIRSGEFKPGDRLGSARQLAEKWEASYGAVRQSLEMLAAKGIVVRRPRAGTFINSKVFPLDQGQGSSGSVARRSIIGLLVPDIRTPEATLVTRNLQDVCNRSHIEVLVSSTDNESDKYQQIIARHIQLNVCGIVLVAPDEARLSLQTLVELQKSRLPVVSYARPLQVGAWPSVQTDTYYGSYIAVRHLCDLGRKRIAYLTYPSSHGSEARVGLYRAIAEFGLTGVNVLEYTLPDNLYLQANGWADSQMLRRVLSTWLDQNPDVDAICCAHDHIAAAAWAVLREKGRRVPEDVAIVGTGNMSEYFGLSAGELTTVDTRVNDAAAEMLRILTQSEDEPRAGVESLTIKPRLVIGYSSVGNHAIA